MRFEGTCCTSCPAQGMRSSTALKNSLIARWRCNQSYVASRIRADYSRAQGLPRSGRSAAGSEHLGNRVKRFRGEVALNAPGPTLEL